MSNENYPLIYLGAPHRNTHFSDLKPDQEIPTEYLYLEGKSWILPEWLEGIHRLDYPKDRITFSLLLNDCEDDSMEVAIEYRRKYGEEYHSFLLEEWKQKAPLYQRVRRNCMKYEFLANTRNKWLSHLAEEEYLFSVDTDIIVEEDTLQKLLSHKVDIISSLISNKYGSYEFNSCNIMEFCDARGRSYLPRRKATNFDMPRKIDPTIRLGTLLEVHICGACYLIHRSVIDAGVHYAHHPCGEDIPFCIQSVKNGFRLWCDKTSLPFHCMNGSMLPALQEWKKERGWTP